MKSSRRRSLAAALFVASALQGCAVSVDHSDVFTLRDRHVPVESVALPTGLDRSALHEVALEVDGRRFIGYRVSARQPARAILFFPGNGYGAPSALSRLTAVFHDHQTDLYVVSYGQPDESPPLVGQTYAMAQALARYASTQSRIPKAQLTAVGHSLGGWVALHLAATQSVGCAVAAGTGTNAVATAKHLLPAVLLHTASLRPTTDVLLLDNLAQARRTTIPTLVIGSNADQVMPPAVSRAIHENLPESGPGELFISESAPHGGYFKDVSVIGRINQFMTTRCHAGSGGRP